MFVTVWGHSRNSCSVCARFIYLYLPLLLEPRHERETSRIAIKPRKKTPHSISAFFPMSSVLFIYLFIYSAISSPEASLNCMGWTPVPDFCAVCAREISHHRVVHEMPLSTGPLITPPPSFSYSHVSRLTDRNPFHQRCHWALT